MNGKSKRHPTYLMMIASVPCLLFACLTTPSTAQSWRALAFQPRGDRIEGLTNLLDVTDDAVDLVGFQVESGPVPETGSGSFYVTYNSQYQGTAEIEISAYTITFPAGLDLSERNRQSWYKMVKSNAHLHGVTSTYSWPTTLPKLLQITPDIMYAVVTLNNRGKREVLPSIIHRGQWSGAVNGYSFTVWPRTTADVSFYVFDAESLTIVWEQHLTRCSAGKPYSVTWNGAANTGRSVPQGKYVLAIRPTFYTMNGKRTAGAKNYYFNHNLTYED